MRRRALIVVAIVASVVVAGCGGLTGAPGADTTAPGSETTAPGGTTDPGEEATTTSTNGGLPASIQYPDHTGPDSIEAEALLDAMASSLADDGYSMNWTYEETNASGVTSRTLHELYRNPDTGTTLYERAPGEDAEPTYGWYSTATTGYRLNDGDVRETESFDWERQTFGATAGVLETLNVTATDTRESGERTLIVYTVTGTVGNQPLSASGEIVVDEAGLVREYHISISSEAGSQSEYSYALTLETPTIEEPAWVSQANATSGA